MQSRKEFFKELAPSNLKAVGDCYKRWLNAATGSPGEVDIPTEDEIDCLFSDFLTLAVDVHHYNCTVLDSEKAIATLLGKAPETEASSCDDCAELRKLADGQNRVIASLASSLKTSNDLIETMSKVIFQRLKQEKYKSQSL